MGVRTHIDGNTRKHVQRNTTHHEGELLVVDELLPRGRLVALRGQERLPGLGDRQLHAPPGLGRVERAGQLRLEELLLVDRVLLAEHAHNVQDGVADVQLADHLLQREVALLDGAGGGLGLIL